MLLGGQDIAFKARLHCALILVQDLQDVTSSVHDVPSDPVKQDIQTLATVNIILFQTSCNTQTEDCYTGIVTCVLVWCQHQCRQRS